MEGMLLCNSLSGGFAEIWWGLYVTFKLLRNEEYDRMVAFQAKKRQGNNNLKLIKGL